MKLHHFQELDGPRDHTKICKPEKKNKLSYGVIYTWNPKNIYTNQLIYKTEIKPQTQKTNLWLRKGKSGEG